MMQQPARYLRWLRRTGMAALLLASLCPGPARADTDAGLAQYRTGQFAEALQSWRDAAEAGDARAALYMGVSYDTGQGVPPDPRTAAAWYRRAADGGNPAAMFNLAVLYGLGLGVPKDLSASLDWYVKAAARSHPRAAFNLGLLYEEGIGTARDPRRAIAAFEQAARLGVTAARAHLAALGRPYAGPVIRPKAQDGMREFQEAQSILLGRQTGGSVTALLRAAAGAGNAMAAYNLGYCYENGIGTPKDYAEALRWYSRAVQGAQDENLRGIATAGRSSAQAKLDPDAIGRLVQNRMP